jgi:DNA repair protein RecO (recombination protein O)
MQIKTRGIVLHTIKFSETSVILKIYTEKLGLVSYIVKGVRSSKSKTKAALLQPLSMLDMEVSHRENKQLQYIKEFSRAYTYQSIPFDTLKSAVALFLLEVITKSVREHEQNEEMFEFIYGTFRILDESEKVNPDFHLIFLIRFSGFIGFMPQRNFSKEKCYFDLAEGSFTSTGEDANLLDSNSSRLLNDLMNANPLSHNSELRITRADRKKMMKNLLKYYHLHLENFSLKSPEILEIIMD